MHFPHIHRVYGSRANGFGVHLHDLIDSREQAVIMRGDDDGATTSTEPPE